jgi:hypothetical protein
LHRRTVSNTDVTILSWIHDASFSSLFFHTVTSALYLLVRCWSVIWSVYGVREGCRRAAEAIKPLMAELQAELEAGPEATPAAPTEDEPVVTSPVETHPATPVDDSQTPSSGDEEEEEE